MRQGAQWLRESKPTVVAELFLCALDLNLIREKRARYGGREISRRTGSPLLSIHSSRLFLVTKITGSPKRQAMWSAWASGHWRAQPGTSELRGWGRLTARMVPALDVKVVIHIVRHSSFLRGCVRCGSLSFFGHHRVSACLIAFTNANKRIDCSNKANDSERRYCRICEPGGPVRMRTRHGFCSLTALTRINQIQPIFRVSEPLAGWRHRSDQLRFHGLNKVGRRDGM